MKINSVSVEAFDNVLDEGRIIFNYETDEGWNQIVFREKKDKWIPSSNDRELLMSLFDKFLTDMGL